MVDDLKPSGEQAVELGEIHPVVDLDQELIANRAKEPLDLPFVWWLRGACVISFHAQNSAHPQQLRGNERQPRSTKIAYGDTARHHPGPQRSLQPEHVLAGTHRQPTSRRE